MATNSHAQATGWRWQWLLLLAVVGCGRCGYESVPGDVDSGLDAGLDAGPDAGLDAGLDASMDAEVDAGLDAGVDAQVDAGLDADVDAQADAGLDAGLDAGFDAGVPCTWTEFGDLEEITGLDVAGNLWAPALSDDGLTMYFGREAMNNEQILFATRTDRGPVFSAAVEVPSFQSPQRDGTPFITSDDLALYFYSERAGGGGGQRDLWVATRTSAGDAFSTVTPLTSINTAAWELTPYVTPDGLTLWFASDRTDGLGASDLWIAQRNTVTDAFDAPTNVTDINTVDHEVAPELSRDGLSLYFASTRPGGAGSYDIWFATRTDTAAAFETPTNLTAANSTGWEADPAVSSDGTELLFSSNRDGTRKLWRLTRQCL